MRTNTEAATPATTTATATASKARTRTRTPASQHRETVTVALTSDQAARARTAADKGGYGTLEQFAAFAVEYVADNILAGNRVCIPLTEGELAAWCLASHKAKSEGGLLPFVRNTINSSINSTTTPAPGRPANVIPLNDHMAVIEPPEPPAPIKGVTVSEFTQTETVELVSISATIIESHAAAFEASARFRPDWFSGAFESYYLKMDIDITAGRERGTFPPRCATYRNDNLIWKEPRGQKLREIKIIIEKRRWQNFLGLCETLELAPLAMVRGAMAVRVKGWKDNAEELRLQEEHLASWDARDANPTPETEAAYRQASNAFAAAQNRRITATP